MKRVNKLKLKSKAFKFLGIFCFLLALALLVITYIMTLPGVNKSFDGLMLYFDSVESFISGLNRPLALLVIMAFFFIKSFIPIVPLSVLFISAGLVFPSAFSFFINAVGFCLLVSVKFFFGKKHGSGRAEKLAKRFEPVKKVLRLEGDGNKLVLFLLRFVPFVPINTVSRLYGTTSMEHPVFVLFSLLGFLPRLVSWSFVGCNITNPFTFSFTLPVIMLLVISGISLILVSFILKLLNNNDNSERTVKNENNRG